MLKCSLLTAEKGAEDLNHFTFIRFTRLHKFSHYHRRQKNKSVFSAWVWVRALCFVHKFRKFSTVYAKEREIERCRETMAPHMCLLPLWPGTFPMLKWNLIQILPTLCAYAMVIFIFSDFHIYFVFFSFLFQLVSQVEWHCILAASTCIMNQRTFWPMCIKQYRFYRKKHITIHTLATNVTSRFFYTTFSVIFFIFLHNGNGKSSGKNGIVFFL